MFFSFLYVSLYILSLLSLHLQEVKFRKGYYSCFVTICSTCMGKLQDRDNTAWFASAATLHKCDFKTLLVISTVLEIIDQVHNLFAKDSNRCGVINRL